MVSQILFPRLYLEMTSQEITTERYAKLLAGANTSRGTMHYIDKSYAGRAPKTTRSILNNGMSGASGADHWGDQGYIISKDEGFGTEPSLPLTV